MNKIDFAMVLHFHQPVGNFVEIFERAYQRCYRPFLEYLPYYPDIRMTLHISGSLLDYLRHSHPEILVLIKELILKGQIELIGSAYYEPILPAIPPNDMKGQIGLMSRALKNEFGRESRGLWISERVWRPEIAKTLHKAGVRYCILDDTHLIRSGVKREDIYGYFVTGSRLRRISVFPSDKKLRYLIPFRDSKETVGYLQEIARREGRLVVYADDVEKLGEWPGTYTLVYEKGWIKGFFDSLIRNKSWINLLRLTECLKVHKPLRSLTIKEASYEEMMEWTAGSWFNFLKKYPETEWMYNKMRYVSDKVRHTKWPFFGKRDERYWANVELYRGECNCGYWHGIFGGLYMYHLRSAIYNHLIAAENIADKVRHRGDEGWSEVGGVDLDGDGKDEFLIENSTLSCYFDPRDGGTLKELDYRPICVNLINGLSRRKEVYHQEVKMKEPTLAKKLIYDRYTRSCLRNYFLKEDLTLERFRSVSFQECGLFGGGEYTAEKIECGVILKHSSDLLGTKIELIKEIRVKGNIIETTFRVLKLKPDGGTPLLFGTEFNMTMPFLNAERYRYFSNGSILGALDQEGEVKDCPSFSIRDTAKELNLGLKFSGKCDKIWYFPVETVSETIDAYRLNFQAASVLLLWRPVFDKEGAWDIKVTWEIG